MVLIESKFCLVVFKCVILNSNMGEPRQIGQVSTKTWFSEDGSQGIDTLFMRRLIFGSK